MSATLTTGWVLIDTVLLHNVSIVLLIDTIILIIIVIELLKTIEASHRNIRLLKLIFERLIEVIKLASRRLSHHGPILARWRALPELHHLRVISCEKLGVLETVECIDMTLLRVVRTMWTPWLHEMRLLLRVDWGSYTRLEKLIICEMRLLLLVRHLLVEAWVVFPHLFLCISLRLQDLRSDHFRLGLRALLWLLLLLTSELGFRPRCLRSRLLLLLLLHRH